MHIVLCASTQRAFGRNLRTIAYLHTGTQSIQTHTWRWFKVEEYIVRVLGTQSWYRGDNGRKRNKKGEPKKCYWFGR